MLISIFPLHFLISPQKKLRIKFVTKRNQRKRQREISDKESEKTSSTKRVKTDEATVETKSIKTEKRDEAQKDDEKTIVKEENTSVDQVANVKTEGETDEDEDPEEDPEEEDEDMEDGSPQHDSANEARFHCSSSFYVFTLFFVTLPFSVWGNTATNLLFGYSLCMFHYFSVILDHIFCLVRVLCFLGILLVSLHIRSHDSC